METWKKQFRAGGYADKIAKERAGAGIGALGGDFSCCVLCASIVSYGKAAP